MRISLPEVFRNPLSLFGTLIALIALIVGGVLLVVNFMVPFDNPYFGIFLYVIAPAVQILGLLLIPLGAWREHRRRLREKESGPARWPVFDLNSSKHRNLAMASALIVTVGVVLASVGTYGAYHYSESVKFCGTTCHEPMKPEHTTYQEGAHAKVPCAECHVGSGAGWFVKSKLSGSYQLYAVLANVFPRPIPTPIESLRPARQTCEECHWPGKVFGSQLKRFRHTLYDEANTEWPIDILIKTGGNEPSSGEDSGIHWHMNLGVEVSYIARDKERQDIPWMRIHDLKTQRVSVYQSKSKPLTPEEIAKAEKRRMDCVDCHNRPSHVFPTPEEAIDREFRNGSLSRAMPSIKTLAVAAMAKEYPTHDDAIAGIASDLTQAYRDKYPEVWNKRRAEIDTAIGVVQKAFGISIFPEMKARWTVYPDNLGHFRTKGCMRCHDGDHFNEAGTVLTQDCRTCHSILLQGSGDRRQNATTEAGLDFLHPEDIGDAWQGGACYDCHTGVRP